MQQIQDAVMSVGFHDGGIGRFACFKIGILGNKRNVGMGIDVVIHNIAQVNVADSITVGKDKIILGAARDEIIRAHECLQAAGIRLHGMGRIIVGSDKRRQNLVPPLDRNKPSLYPSRYDP